jgi:dTDP-4-amino-4,6-dideoxygalactose transaminase
MSEAETTGHDIPFNRACLVGREFVFMAKALDQMHVSGDGGYSKACHALLERLLGVPKALLTTSCTHALEMAALLLEIAPGDEVIVPSFTFVSTANAFALRGAKIVFADIRPDTLNIDESKLERLITGRTRVVVAVHYGGVSCEMDAIMGVCAARRIVLVEDNAHGMFGKYRGRPLGTFGTIAALSFHETKNVTCGEGGAILVNDPSLIEQADIIRQKGTNRVRFFRGEVDKYTWVGLGSSYLPSDLLAAFLLAQLESSEYIQSLRQAVWNRYHQGLEAWANRWDVKRPEVPAHCQQAYHMYYLVMPTPAARDGLIDWLKSRGVSAVFHYQPLHLSKMGESFGGRAGDCPVTERISPRLLRLPFFNLLSVEDQAFVIDAVSRFRC